jgi:hypothetical protein
MPWAQPFYYVVSNCIAPSRRVTYVLAKLEAVVAVIALGLALDLLDGRSRGDDSDESEHNTYDELHGDDVDVVVMNVIDTVVVGAAAVPCVFKSKIFKRSVKNYYQMPL